MKYLLSIILLTSILSCREKQKVKSLSDKQRQLEAGTLDSANQYAAKEIGWTTTIPKGWEIRSKEESRKNTERGKESIEKTINAEVDASGLVQLLNLYKNKFNIFLSTMEPYDEKANGSYDENNKKLQDIIKDTYAGQGIHSTGREDSATIDGLRFHLYKIKIYNKEKTEVILNQWMYSRLINGYDFGMTINFNNEEDKAELEGMVLSSKFSERD